MHHVLIYGDSLSWGIIPNTRQRLPFPARWPGVLEAKLVEMGASVRVIEDCLNGRRTVWDDPFKPGRNGLEGLSQKMEIHSPLSAVILMLGTNFFQFCHPYNDAWSAAQGIATLVNVIRKAPIEPDMPVPPVLVVSPPPIRTPQGDMAPKFRGAEEIKIRLNAPYSRVASDLGCDFFDAETATSASAVDGVHLDADQHLKLGTAMAPVVHAMLARQRYSA